MARKKRNKILEMYSGSWRFIKSSKNYIYAIIILFILSSAFGFLFPVFFEDQIMVFVQRIISETEGFGSIEMIIFLLRNNLQSAFIGMFFGIFLGIVPFINSVANGYVLGFVASEIVSIEGIFILWRILPHGIFELPALFLALGMGLKIGSFIFQKKKIYSLKYYLYNSSLVFLLFVIPLLIIAAIIEGTLIVFVG
jgi:stage II sporulation protein M